MKHQHGPALIADIGHKTGLINHLVSSHLARNIIPQRWTMAALKDLHDDYHAKWRAEENA